VADKKKKQELIPASPAAVDTSFRKAVEAIAVKPLAGKLTLLTRKVNNVLLAEAQDQGVDQPIYRIPLSRLCSKADYDSSNTALLKEQLRKMSSTTVEWQTGVKGARRWGVTNLVNVEIIEEGNRCFVEWDYPIKLKEKLLAPDVYARLSLQMQNTFRSASALALYEICVRYLDSPGQLTMRMPWSEWRPVLTGVADSEEGTYLQYKYFKRDVVNHAIKEVNDLTHIQVELIEHKEGRSVSDLQFSVKPRSQAGLALDDPNLFDLSLIDRLKTLGFTQAQAEKTYSDTDESRLRQTLNFVEGKIKAAKPPIAKPAAYFRDALKRGYGLATTTAPLLERKVVPTKAKGKPTGEQKLLASLAEAWWSEQRRTARETFDNLDPAEQADQLVVFADSKALPPMLRKQWQADGLNNQMCNAAFNHWLVREIREPSSAELLQYGLVNGLLAQAQA